MTETIVLSAVEQMQFDYAALDPDTRGFIAERAEAIHALARRTAQGIVDIGRLLAEVKERVGHGQFLSWIDHEFDWSQPTAWRFMNVYEQFKLCNLNNLSIDVSALYLIAAPRTPEPVRHAVLEQAEQTHVSFSDVKRIIREERAKREDRLTMTETPEPSPEEIARAREIRGNMARNQVWVSAFMAAMGAVETLSRPGLSVEEMARLLRRFDTADKNWTGRASQARQMLAELEEALQQ
jgi:hypothetical protein